MAINFDNLSPEDQNQLAALFQKAQAPAPQDQGPVDLGGLKPGQFKDDPAGAMKAIEQLMMSKATGPQLGESNGQLTTKTPVDQPLLRLFGMKKTVPVNSANYADAVKEAGIADFLPSGLPRTPDGSPFVSEKVSDQAKQLAATKKDSGSRLLSPEESKLTIGYWKEAAPTLVPLAEEIMSKQGALPEWLGKAGPSYRTKRSELGTVQGFTEEGDAVEYDMTEKKWYVGGKETPANQVGRLLSKTRPQMTGEQINEVTNLLNAGKQLEEVERLFDPKAVGPIESKLQSFQEFTGVKLPDLHGLSVMTDDRIKLKTVMSSAINDYIKAITGAQMSEPEARRIMKALPKPGSADEAFLPTLHEIMKVTKMKLNTRLDVLETQDTVGIKKLRQIANGEVGPQVTTPQATPKKKKSLGSIFGGK